MKKPIILLLGTCLCLFIVYLTPLRKSAERAFENGKEKFEEREEEESEEGEYEENESEEEKEKESGVVGQMMSWFTARAYPDPYYMNDKYMNGWYQAKAMRHQQNVARGLRVMSGTWNNVGPDNSLAIGGRMLTIAVDPTNGNNLFAGSASGGIWKSTNQGASWTPVTTDFPVLGVSSIIIHPTNGNIIYAGTGEVYRVDSTSGTPNPGNVGFNVWKTRGTYGIGVLKSTDGGVTWSQYLNRTTSQLFAIQTLRFDPANANTIYACATDGLYRSTDAGVNWTKILNHTYISDVVINGTSLVAAVGNLGNTVKGIFRSTNNGSTWTKITAGLPASFLGFIKFGYVPADANNIVASIGVSEAAGISELYRSTDFGLNWTALTGSKHTDWQYWSAHDVAINPSNTSKFIYAGVNMYSYTLPSTAAGVGASVHDDIHDIIFDPTTANAGYVCCDGGIYRFTNAGATPSFTRINNGLNATQFYASVGVSPATPNIIAGGLQDNGQIVYNNGAWNTVSGGGGDGAACAISPASSSVMLVSRDARQVYRSTNSGASASAVTNYWGAVADSRTAFVAPLAWSKSTTTTVYLGSDNLHKSTDGGLTFTNNAYGTATNYIDALHKTAITLAVSPTNANKLYASVSNFAQFDNDVDNLYLTGSPNVLKTLTGNTPFSSIKGAGATALPNRFIMDFAISKTFDDSVFVAVGGFGTPHIYVTGNGGSTWASVDNALPDVPFNSILIDPINPKILYAGGDMGVYVSPNRGVTWYDYNNGFWDGMQIMDLQATADNQIVAATHGKGLFLGPRFTGTLPVNIISFTGEALPSSNKLEWKVAQEVNLSRYELERSSNNSNYQKIGTVTPNNAASYTYNDLIPSNITYSYRLKMVDADGTFKYSDIVYLKRTAKQMIQVVGNPFTTRMQIQLSVQENSNTQFNLYSSTGQLLRSQQTVIMPGQGIYSIDNLGILPGGTYIVEVIINNQRWRQKVLKK